MAQKDDSKILSKSLKQSHVSKVNINACCRKSFKFVTDITSKFYMTSAPSAETLNESKVEENTEEVFIHSNPEANEICKIILCEKDINKLMDEKFLEKNSLARKLFKTGVSLADISVNAVQERFISSLIEKKIIFFPTGITTQIFEFVFKTRRGTTFYITCQKGLGKSFSSALLVLLLRQDTNKRVFYINDPVTFIADPLGFFAEELKNAFPEEFQDKNINLEEEIEKIKGFRTSKQNTFYFFEIMNKITAALNKKGKELFIIIDQVNSLEKSKMATFSEKIAYSIFRYLRKKRRNATIMLIASVTDEEHTESQEYPIFSLKSIYPTDKMAEDFLLRRLGEQRRFKGKDQIYQILKSTGKHPLMMNELFQYYDRNEPDQSLRNFKMRKINDMTEELENYFQSNSVVNPNIILQRKKTMMIVLYTLLGGPAGYDGESELPLHCDGRHIDQRYFIYNKEKSTIKAINPIAVYALKQILDDLEILNQTINYFHKNPSGLGRILQDLILKLPGSTITEEYPLIPFFDREVSNIKFFFRKFRRVDCEYEELFDFSFTNFLNVPKLENFAAFDGFLITHSDVFAIQVKKNFERSDLVALLESLKEAISDQNSDEEENTIKSEFFPSEQLRRKAICGFVKKAIQSAQETSKVLNILLISISQDPKNDPAFEEIRNCQDLPINCYYLDAKQPLTELGIYD